MSPDVIERLRQTRNANDVIKGLQSVSKLKTMQTSLIVKVVDGQREVITLVLIYYRDITTKVLKLFLPETNSYQKISYQNFNINLCPRLKLPNSKNCNN